MTDLNPDQTTVLLAKWDSSYTMTLIKFSIMTVIFIGLVATFLTIGSIQELTKNFPRYRCNPAIMPFASNFGYDTQANFNYCLTNIFNVKAAEIFAPIYGLLSQFTTLVTLIMNVALGIRKLFSNFLLGVNNFMRNVRDRIQGLLFNVRMSFLKINNLMGRVYGTMYAVIWMGTSALTAGMNVADNDLIKFLFEFCFDPNTPVKMSDGSYKRITDVVIGDRLASVGHTTPVVSSVLRFNGAKTPMVKIQDVVVSAAHYVVGANGAWIMAADHPDAICVPSIPTLVCLNVSGHTFTVGECDLRVADYDEHSSHEVVRSAQTYATKALNGRAGVSDTVDDYSLGIDGKAQLRMVDGSYKSMCDVMIGDETWNSGTVLGLVSEECDDVVQNDGVAFSSAQLLFDASKGMWVRAANLFDTPSTNNQLFQVITERCSALNLRCGTKEYFIRDYREVADPNMESAYMNEFLVA